MVVGESGAGGSLGDDDSSIKGLLDLDGPGSMVRLSDNCTDLNEPPMPL